MRYEITDGRLYNEHGARVSNVGDAIAALISIVERLKQDLDEIKPIKPTLSLSPGSFYVVDIEFNINDKVARCLIQAHDIDRPYIQVCSGPLIGAIYQLRNIHSLKVAREIGEIGKT